MNKDIGDWIGGLGEIPEPVDSRTQDYDPNSMLYWFPKIEQAGLPVPRTVLVRFDNRTVWPAMDGKPIPDAPWDEFKAAATEIGLPCFLRADQSSAKHDGPTAYRLDDLAKVESLIVRTFEDNGLKDLTVHAFAFREWLDLDATFTAFGWGNAGHPIAREWRVFADSEKCWCAHFYWPDTAIEQYNPSASNWRELLAAMSNDLSDDTRSMLEALAVSAVRALGGSPLQRWSVDFAQDRAGKWWLIDMAVARMSWHPDCTVPDEVW